MLYYLYKRIAYALPILIGVSVIAFALIHIVPGDPVDSLLGQEAKEADRLFLRNALGLDLPLYQQYFKWLAGLFHLNFGISISRMKPVSDLILNGLSNTLILAAAAIVLSVLLGGLFGTIAAYFRGTWVDRVFSVVGLAGVSLPHFWIAIVLIVLFAVKWQVFPASGMYGYSGGGKSFGDLIAHLILPAIAASATTIGTMTRMVRIQIIQVLQEDYYPMLMSKGLSSFRIFLHVWKNAMPAILTILGLEMGHLFGGSILVETVFSWPGLGGLIYQSISQRDIPIIQSGILLISVIYVCLNVLVDIMHGLIDPRIRHT
jgi:peptide/nickel transport system permease protein